MQAAGPYAPPTHAGWGEVAAATGAVAAARALGPTMMQRTLVGRIPTATVAGMLGMAAGVAGEATARVVDAATPLDRMQAHLIVGSSGLATAVLGRRFSGTGAAAAASIGAVLAVTGGLGAALDAAHGRFDTDGDGRFGPDLPNGVIVAGVGAVAVVAGARFGRTAVTAMKNAPRITQTGPAADAAGQALGELIPRSKLTMAGRLFLEGTTEGLPKRPVRTYMPFELDGMTLQQRVALTVDSMVQQGAFERSRIVIASPTGTGGINPGPVIMDEVLSGGDTAWVVAQYGRKPSVQSLHRTPAAVEAFMELTRQVAAKSRQLHPNGDGPRLYAAATSLGSRNLHEAIVQHGDELFGPRVGLRRVLLLGAPEQLTSFHPRLFPDGMVGRFRDPAAIAAVSDDAARSMRVVEFAHWDDPVRLAHPRMAIERPAFLTPQGAIPGVRHDRPFTPGVTMVQHAFDTTTSISRGTGDRITRVGHDYRGDMQQAVALAFDHRGAGVDAIESAGRFAQDKALADIQRIRRILAGGPA
jgi:hypothetical protein